MIQDSYPWKRHIKSVARKLAKWQIQKHWTEATMFALEREIFFSFYAIRKLLDAKTLISFQMRDSPLSLQVYTPTAKKADLMNSHKVDELYDLSQSSTRNFSLLNVCNYIVQSYVFTPTFSEDGLHSILFNSDRIKERWLLEFNAERIQSLFESFATDGVSILHMSRDANGDWQVDVACNGSSHEDGECDHDSGLVATPWNE